jgi:two-component system chemotaxis response regulator CheY
VLLLDITLPDMDGFELLVAVRALAGFEATPAIAVTGRSSERDKASVEAAGFARHFVKPFDVHELGQAIVQLAREPRSGVRAPFDGA